MSTKEQKFKLSALHFEHTNWMSELELWKLEITSFKKRLEEIVQNWTNKVVLAKVEQFQNQFIRHNEVIDILSHDIKKHEHQLSKFAEEHPVAIDHRKFTDHSDHREQMETERKIYQEMKQHFFRFLTEVM